MSHLPSFLSGHFEKDNTLERVLGQMAGVPHPSPPPPAVIGKWVIIPSFLQKVKLKSSERSHGLLESEYQSLDWKSGTLPLSSHSVLWPFPVVVFFGKPTVQLQCKMWFPGLPLGSPPRCCLSLDFLPGAHLKNPSDED